MSKRGVLINGMPKAGTNLVKSAVSLLPGFVEKRRFTGFIPNTGMKRAVDGVYISLLNLMHRPMVRYGVDWPREIPEGRMRWILGRLGAKEYIQSHIGYSPEAARIIRESGVSFLVVMRDPRDIVVSHVKYVMSRPNHYLYQKFASMDSDQQRLMVSICGFDDGSRIRLQSIADRLDLMARWEEEFPGHTLFFENLVGPRGGGDVAIQAQEIARLLRLVGQADPDGSITHHIVENIFGIGRNFRKGRIGGWREHFGPEHVAAFKKVAARNLVDLRYESDDTW